DMGQDFAFINFRAVVDGVTGVVKVLAEVIDGAGQLCSDIDDFFGFDGTGGADGGSEVTAIDGRGAKIVAGFVAAFPIPATHGQRNQDDNDQHDPLTHAHSS